MDACGERRGTARGGHERSARRAQAHRDLLRGNPRESAERENLQFWAARHFGDTTPGAATRRFHEAVERLLAEWDRNAALHADDSPDHSGDGAEDDEDHEGMPET